MSALAMAEKVERFYGNPEAAALIRSQHEGITKLRKALDDYMTGDMIAEGFGSGVGGNYFRNAEEVIKETENLT